MELQTALENRRSTRAFTDRRLTRAEIDELLRAATLAPSACNMQSWYFYIIADENERAKLKGICADWIASAPVVFIVCTDRDGIVSRFGRRAEKFPVQDTALAMENLLLKAADMGLGGCIIGAYKQEECTKTFGIPEKHHIVALLPVGEPARKTPPTERKPVSEVSCYIGSAPKEGDSRPPEASSMPLDLKNGDFSGSSFENVKLDGSRIGCCEECEKEGRYCVEMRRSVFDSADMTRSQLNHCALEESVLTDIRMAGSKLYDIDLDGGKLSGVNMVNADIQCLNLFGASFKNCCLSNAEFENCDTDGMTVSGIPISDAIEAYKKLNR